MDKKLKERRRVGSVIAALPPTHLQVLRAALAAGAASADSAWPVIRGLPAKQRREFKRLIDVRAKLAQAFNEIREARSLKCAPSLQHRLPALAVERRDLARRLETPVRERLAKTREAAAIKAATEVLKSGGAGGTTWTVHVAPEGADPSYRCWAEKVWGVYAKSCRYPGIVDHHTITLAPNWLRDVRRYGSMIDGKLFLGIVKTFVDTPNRQIHLVALARQGRGYDVVTEQRFLSCWPHGVVTVHGSFAKACAEGVPDRLREIEDSLARARKIDEADVEALADLELA